MRKYTPETGTTFIFTFYFNSLKMLFLFSELIGDYLKVKDSKEVCITKFVIIKNRTYHRFMICNFRAILFETCTV